MKIKKRQVSAALLISIAAFVAVSYWWFAHNKSLRQSICLEQVASTLHNGALPSRVFEQQFELLQNRVERSLVARSVMLEVANRISANDSQPISSNDLYALKSGSESYLNLRNDLYAIANAYECAPDVSLATLDAYGIEPELRLKALMLSLSAALTLYDNYLLGVALFERDERLRKILNDPDTGFGVISNRLTEATLAANSVEVRRRARAAIEFYENEKHTITKVSEDSEFAYLSQLIDSSPSFNYVKKIRVGEIASKKFVAFEKISSDFVAEAAEEGLDVVSGLFGNTVGLYESRKGKLYGDIEAKKKIQSVLQPLDILLEKTPFRLTDKLIPGHFGHVAIWTGTKTELIDAQVWDDLYVEQYANQVSSDSNPNSKDEQQIIEALRNGVQLNTLDQFMNVDDIAILRPVFSGTDADQQARQALLLAFRQVGKEYDFNFDVNTTDKIVCSELAYVSFPTFDWPTAKTLGRHSISPDHVAQLAWNNVPLELVMLYHDGKLVNKANQLSKMQSLMTR